MATFFYAVWASAAEVANGPVLNENKVTISGTAAQSGLIDSTGAAAKRNRRVRLFADSACFVTWGESPTALNDGTEGRPMGAENPEYVDIPAHYKISVIERV